MADPIVQREQEMGSNPRAAGKPLGGIEPTKTNPAGEDVARAAAEEAAGMAGMPAADRESRVKPH